MALQVKIKKRLGEFNLDVEFETSDGVFAILGASGCGKSMTLKCIAGIETPDEGKIILNGRILYDSKEKINLSPQKRKVGYMFQDYALFPNMTVLQNIKAGMGKKADEAKAQNYARQYHLEGLETHYPAQLSGGQKQRVAMARIMASEPEAILLDEPFAALDSYLKWEMEQQMREILSKVGKPTLFVSHNRDEVYRLCQTVSCICNGKMEVIEPVKEFFRNPKTRTAAILSGCKNISAARIIDAHHIEAIDWNTILHCETIPEGTDVIGIRAHRFYVDTEEERQSEQVHTGEKGRNSFPVNEYRILEDPFEWNISFRKGKDGGWLQWKIAKSDWNMEMQQMPEKLWLNNQDILFLKGEKER